MLDTFLVRAYSALYAGLKLAAIACVVTEVLK